jgi:hypothetical protein
MDLKIITKLKMLYLDQITIVAFLGPLRYLFNNGEATFTGDLIYIIHSIILT